MIYYLKVSRESLTYRVRLPDRDKGFYVANSAYVMSTTLIKVSLLLQYLRVFKSPILRTVCYFLLITTSLWGFAYSFLAWVPCVPVYDFWSLTLAESDKTCFGYGSSTRGRFVETYLSHAGVNMTLDILILSLPIYLISKKIDAPISRTALLGLLLGGSV